MSSKRLLGLCGWLVLAGCLGAGTAGAEEPAKAAKPRDLVVFYSYTGKTALVGKTLADLLKAEAVRIEDVERPSRERAYGAGREASLKGEYWPIRPVEADVARYDRVFLGCPVWFGLPPPPFNAFLEQVNLTGKQVVVFVTLGGGAYDKAIQALTDKAAARGGRVVASFHVRTQSVSDDALIAKASELARQYGADAAP